MVVRREASIICDALVPVPRLNIMARGFFPFGPFMCGLGADKQIASSYDEIIHFYAQATEFNRFYLFYVLIGFNLFLTEGNV